MTMVRVALQPARRQSSIATRMTVVGSGGTLEDVEGVERHAGDRGKAFTTISCPCLYSLSCHWNPPRMLSPIATENDEGQRTKK